MKSAVRQIAAILLASVFLVVGTAQAHPVGRGGGRAVVWVFTRHPTNARASMTWGNINTTNQGHFRTPWHRSVGYSGAFDVVSILAQDETGMGGIVLKCVIKVGGRVVRHSTAHGAYSICSANWSP